MFRVWCFLLPMIGGFGVPAMLASRAGARGAFLFLGAVATLTLGFGLAARATGAVILNVTLFTLAFAVLAAGVHLLFPWPRVGQIVSGCVVSALMASLFAFMRAFEPSSDLASIQPRIEWALAVSPFAVMAISIFEIDLLHHAAIYSDISDYIVARPEWGPVALWYVILGFVTGATGIGTRMLLGARSTEHGSP
jgi:hypothetical protein